MSFGASSRFAVVPPSVRLASYQPPAVGFRSELEPGSIGVA